MPDTSRFSERTALTLSPPSVDPTPELMKGLGRLFGREAVLLEAEV